jgi:hypothetical protein
MMKSRTIAVALMFSSLLVVAASGQVNNANTFPRPIGELVLQDDDSGDYLLIDLSSGGYKFKSCTSDFVLGGIAQVGFSGCSVSLKEVSESRLVLIEADLCSGQGRAYIEVAIGGLYSTDRSYTRVFTVTDTNTKTSAPECKAEGK